MWCYIWCVKLFSYLEGRAGTSSLNIKGEILLLAVRAGNDGITSIQIVHMQVSVYFHVQLTETSKQGSLNIADLGISTSSFFNLDNTTSWVCKHGGCKLTSSKCVSQFKNAGFIDFDGKVMLSPIYNTSSIACSNVQCSCSRLCSVWWLLTVAVG